MQYHKCRSAFFWWCIRTLSDLVSTAHPCNMKEFKVMIGMEEHDMTEVLHASLKDDNVPETFPLRNIKAAGVYTPSRFLKIIPLT